MIPDSHLGAWAGPSRLFYPDPLAPQLSEGTMVAEPTLLTYTWTVDDGEQTGALQLSGPVGSVRGDWRDTWHADAGQVAHGCWTGALLRLWSTYPAGEEAAWGWRIEIDARDPEHLVLQMFNVIPDAGEEIAHVLRGARPV